MMTDFSDQVLFEQPEPDVLLYDSLPTDVAQSLPSALESGDNFALDSHTDAAQADQKTPISQEGFPGSYIPQCTEADLHAYPIPYYTHGAEQYLPAEASHGVESCSNSLPVQHGLVAPTHPATMTQFFHMMSHPENVHAYMHFLQTQHEQQPPTQPIAAPSRARSNSQPTSSSLPSAFPSRASCNDTPFDNQSRERKLARYRTKRAKRLASSQPNNIESSSSTTPMGDPEALNPEHFMPAAKIPKTLAHDLENRLASSEEEVRLLRNVLESRDVELAMLRQAILEEQQYQQWAMQFGGDASSNASSSATSPRPRSPSTPAMVSSPSNISLGSSAMDTDFTSLDTSSIGSDVHMMEVMAQHSRRQEKLKALGGPPSDVYHPWYGISLNHPAFSLKEDWQSVELRPQSERLAQERLNYFLMMQRYRMEQQQMKSDGSSEYDPQHVLPAPAQNHPHDPAQMTHPYTHQPASFYQSPHQSHILTGVPVQSSGFWSGHFAPANAEKIDFSKISLRKTSGESIHPEQQHPLHPATMHLQPPPHSPMSPHSPVHLQPHQTSPTAAIWRDAMAHPEMHRFPMTRHHWSGNNEDPSIPHPTLLRPPMTPGSAQVSAVPSSMPPSRIPFRRQQLAPYPTTPAPAKLSPSARP